MACDAHQGVDAVLFHSEGAPTIPLESRISRQLRPSQPTLLAPRPSPPAHSIELWIVSFARTLNWQSLLLRIGTWIVVEKSINDLGNSVLWKLVSGRTTKLRSPLMESFLYLSFLKTDCTILLYQPPS